MEPVIPFRNGTYIKVGILKWFQANQKNHPELVHKYHKIVKEYDLIVREIYNAHQASVPLITTVVMQDSEKDLPWI